MPNYDEYGSQWEGRSPNAAADYGRMVDAGAAPDNSWLSNLFGRRRSDKIASTPLPPMVGTDEGRFPPSPFEGTRAPAAPKSASKISSAGDIAKRISQIVQQPWQGEGDTATFEPIHRTQQPWHGEGDTQSAPDANAILRAFMQANPEPSERAPRVPIDMRGDANSSATDQIAAAVAQLLGGGNRFGGAEYGGYKTPSTRYGGHQAGMSGRINQAKNNLMAGTVGGGPFSALGRLQLPEQEVPAGGYDRSRSNELPPYDLPYLSRAHGGSIPGYAAGGFSADVPGPDELPHMMGLPKQVVQNNPQTPAATAAPPAFPSSSGGDKGSDPMSGIMSMLPLALAFLKKGGEVPHLMRGGYPELRTAPIRHQFDSGGGQSYVEGDSDGRADDIDAKLSSGEYVLTAEDVALLGNGNSKAGAKKMDQFRVNLRKHKGRALAEGKISPNAKKNPAEYLTGDAISDGIRRLGKK